MSKFTIYRDSWLRGDGRGMLLRPEDNRVCCLGQICFQAGVPLLELEDQGSPADLDQVTIQDIQVTLPGLFRDDEFISDSDAAEGLMRLNDLPNGEVLREEALTAEFADLGMEVTFVDGIAPWFAAETVAA